MPKQFEPVHISILGDVSAVKPEQWRQVMETIVPHLRDSGSEYEAFLKIAQAIRNHQGLVDCKPPQLDPRRVTTSALIDFKNALVGARESRDALSSEAMQRIRALGGPIDDQIYIEVEDLLTLLGTSAAVLLEDIVEAAIRDCQDETRKTGPKEDSAAHGLVWGLHAIWTRYATPEVERDRDNENEWSVFVKAASDLAGAGLSLDRMLRIVSDALSETRATNGLPVKLPKSSQS
jgi:hypothetical protein